MLAAVVFILSSSTASSAAPRHSIGDYAFLIGKWTCTARANGKTTPYRTAFSWMYPEHTVILQSFSGPRGHASFILTYNAKLDDFRGVFVESERTGDATVGAWINPGMQGKGWTEHGYDIDADGFPIASKSTFSNVTKTHYVIRDYLSTPGKTDQLVQVEVCNKVH